MSTTLRARTALVRAATLVPAAVTTTVVVSSAEASTAAAPVVLRATLNPEGDPNGTGSAVVRLNRERNRVCAALEWRRIQNPDAAHIHRKSDGSIVIDLSRATVDGVGCTNNAGRKKIRNIVDHPRRYYVNVHNARYPAGAILGTLRR